MTSNRFNLRALVCYPGFLAVGLLTTTLLGLKQLAGNAGVLLFIRNDVLTNAEAALFIVIFPLAFIAGYLSLLFFLRLPAVDFPNRILAINVACFTVAGLILSALRVPLLSRTVFISEFVLTLCLLIVFYFLRNRLIPRRVAVLDGVTLEPFDRHPAIAAIRVNWQSLQNNRYDAVVGNLRAPKDDEGVRALAELASRNIGVQDAHLFIERLWGRIPLDHLTAVEIETFIPPVFYSKLKRVSELLAILLTLPLTLLVGTLIAIAIRLDSVGPVFFRQRRVGLSGSTFVMWKFRSMRHDSDSVDRFAQTKDSRITQFGGFLRRFRLDELPQLWNVVKGEMSLIGPRPEQENFVARYRELIPFFDFRHTVPPGITGWAQVMYGYADSDERARAKLEFDFYYIKRMSAWLDILVLMKTLRTVIFGVGAR